ncbi:MAG: histidine kinase [Burkholderiaceae bacterium]|nr:histidine kinase [Burkholderiaceae bacterium]
MSVDLLDKLRRGLQTAAFCLAISAIQFAFQPVRGYEVPLVYSLFIGMTTWLLIDFGRHAWPSSRLTGWPQGFAGIALPVGGIALGYLAGTLGGDWWFGWSSWEGRGREDLSLSVLITAMAGITASYFFYSRTRRAWLEARVAEAQRQASESRLKLLETQLEPHMLFNTLANLRALIGIDPPRAQIMLDHLNSYLRATLSGSLAALHPLADEFARLQDYLALMAVRMGPRLQSRLALPAELGNVPVPPLLLQPLVENAIRHGLEPKIEGGQITVKASADHGTLLLEVIDTGVGMTSGAPQTRTGSGFGLTQVRERLAASYDGEARVDVESSPGAGVSVRIRLPLGPAAQEARI